MKKGYVLTVAWLLLLTAIMKLAGLLAASDAFLRASDPLLPFLNNGIVMAAAALVELVCYFLIRHAFARSISRQLMVIIWCASLFAIYRLGLLAINYTGPCKCLGSWGGVLGLDDRWVNTASMVILAYLLVPSIILLVFHRSRRSFLNQPAAMFINIGPQLMMVAVPMVGLLQPSDAIADLPSPSMSTNILVEPRVNMFCAMGYIIVEHLISDAISTPKNKEQISFKHKGELIYSHDPGRMYTNAFIMNKNGFLWSIHTEAMNHNDIIREMDAYDGTNRVHIKSFGDHWPAVNDSIGIVDSSPVPKHYSGRYASVVWLAMASGEYFQTNLGSSMESLIPMTPPNKNSCVKYAIWEISKDKPGLPLWVRIYSSSLHFLPDGSTNHSSESLGYVKEEYKAIRWTNLHNLTIPAIFTYEIFKSQRSSILKTKETIPTVRVTGFVTNILLDRLNDHRAHRITKVADWRENKPYITYMITNGVVPNTNSETYQLALRKSDNFRGMRSQSDSSLVGPRMIFSMLILMLIVAPLIAVLFKKVKTGEPANNQTQN